MRKIICELIFFLTAKIPEYLRDLKEMTKKSPSHTITFCFKWDVGAFPYVCCEVGAPKSQSLRSQTDLKMAPAVRVEAFTYAISEL